MRGLGLVTSVIFWAGCESAKPVVDEGTVEEDTACEPGNEPPTVEITSHDDAALIAAGTTETFEALVSDPDDALSDLTVNWYANGALVCADAPVDFTGKTDCDVAVAGPFSVIRVEVTDPDDARDEDVVVVLAEDTDPSDDNTPPTCEITAPSTGFVGDVGALIVFEGVVGDAQDPVEELNIRWVSDLDGELDTSAADESGAVGFESSVLSVGNHFIALYVSDSAGAVCVDWISVDLQGADEPDNPPEVNITSPTDDAAFEVGESVTFVAVVSDVEDEDASLSVVWTTEDGEVLSTEGPDEDGLVTFSTDALDPGERIITITVTDSAGNTTTDSVTIVVDSPAETGGGDSADGSGDGSDVDADDDGGSDTSGSGTGTGDATGGDTSGDDSTGGDTTSGGADGGGTTGDTDGDDGEVPLINELNLSPDPAYTNDGMVCTPTSATPGSSFSYRWELNDETVAGVAGAVLDDSFHKKNDVVQCFATPYLGSETGAEAASNIVVIRNTPPTAPTVRIEPSAPDAEDDLICIIDVESTDIDGDAIEYEFSWTVDGTPFFGATSSSLARIGDSIPYVDTIGGQSWVCTVTPFDGEEYGPSDTDTVTIEDECPPLGGDGRDGALTIETPVYTVWSSRTTVVGDHPADGVSFTVADASGFMAGDELFVQATRGASDDCMTGGAGDWQLVRVARIDGDTIFARDPLSLPILTSDGGRHQVLRIPQFSRVSIATDSTLTAPAFDGETGGVLILRTQELRLDADAHIDMTGRGFRGGSGDVGFAEHHGGRTAMVAGSGGFGGAALGAAGPGDNGAGGGAGGGVSTMASGSFAGGGGGGMGSIGGAGGSGTFRGGSGGVHPTLHTAGGGGGAASASVYPTCDEVWGERFVFGSGGQLGGGGGCAAGGAGGDAFDAGCSIGGAGSAGGGIVILLADSVEGAAGAQISANGLQGGVGGSGQSAVTGDASGGGGAGNGGVGGGGGKVFLMSSVWGTGTSLIDAQANGGLGGLGGEGGAGGCVSGLVVPGGRAGEAGSDAPDGCAGGGGGGQSGSNGAAGQVLVFGFGSGTPVSFPHIADPAYGIEFDGGIECAIEF